MMKMFFGLEYGTNFILFIVFWIGIWYNFFNFFLKLYFFHRTETIIILYNSDDTSTKLDR
jgi:hypothetical protein